MVHAPACRMENETVRGFRGTFPWADDARQGKPPTCRRHRRCCVQSFPLGLPPCCQHRSADSSTESSPPLPGSLWAHRIHRVPKLATPLASITLSSVCHWLILTKYCTLHYRSITYRHTYCDVRTLPCVFSVTSLWRQSLFTLGLRSIRCYWQNDQAVAYAPKTKSLHRGQRWPI